MAEKTIETGDAPKTEDLLKVQQQQEIAVRANEAEHKELIGHQGNKTTLVGKDGGAQKLVKIRALRNIDYKGITMLPGEVAEVPEEFAKEFCTPITGAYSFAGERSDFTSERAQISRAERV